MANDTRVVHRHVLVVLALSMTRSASAMTRVASDGSATISELELLVEPDAWTVRARLDGNARRVALLFPVTGEATASLAEPALLDRLDYATSPRMKVLDASDPCGAPEEEVLTELWPSRETEPKAAFTTAVIAPLSSPQLDAALPGLSLDPESSSALTRAVRDGNRLVVLAGAAPGKMRGFWTPPVRISVRSRSIPIGLAAAQITVGKDLRIDLYTRDALAPKQKVADLPSEIFLPEVTFEDPIDLFRASTAQTIRREGDGTAIRIFSGEVQRWFLQVGRRDHRASIELEERTASPFRATWMIRRVWRQPIACSAKERYLNIVRIQQKTEIQTYAAITGRPQSSIEALMKVRGYLLENAGLKPVKVTPPDQRDGAH